MVSVLIIGQPNVGKTSFLLNFARYLGLEEVKFMIKQPAGFISTRTYTLDQAYDTLISDDPHKTDNIHSIKLNLPVGKHNKVIRLVDSCGLSDEGDINIKNRKAMAQTLQELIESEIILHMIDLSQFQSDFHLGVIDQEIYSFLFNKAGYKVLANKVDLDFGFKKLSKLNKVVDKRLVIPISALYQEGFTKVKSFLLENV
ncbi:GTPase [Halonatronum saccharophilum]|uniref:GTPase n=1 Tax=Halonatronum saccharophilum TaxID=150060 RepID=UPI0004822D72|nr:GTPase [Halonatronum saccharophilum]